MLLRQTWLPLMSMFLLVDAMSWPGIAGAQSTTTQPSLIGQYKAQHGEPKDSYYSIMTLELQEDGKMSSSLTMADPTNPGHTTEKKVEGTWTQSGDTITVTADTLDGHPVETNNPRKTLLLTITDGGRQLTSDGGPHFTRQ